VPRSPVFTPATGELVYVDDADLRSALAQGYRVATPEDVKLEQIKEDYGGVPGAVGAAVTGALSTASLGITDLAAKALGADELVRNLEIANPNISLVGKGAGMIIPALATGGGSLGARALAATPAGLAARAGQAASRAVGARLGAAATTVGGTAARFAADAATESFIQGASEEAARTAIDGEFTGESVGRILGKGLITGAVGAGIGAPLGALGGVALRATGMRRVANAIDDAAAAPLSAKAPDGIRQEAWTPFRQKLLEISAKVRGADPEGAKEYLEYTAARKFSQDAAEERAKSLATGLPPRTRINDAGAIEDAAAMPPAIDPQRIIDDAAAQAEEIASQIAKSADEQQAAADALLKLSAKGAAERATIRKNLDDYLLGEEVADLLVRDVSLKTDALVAKNINARQLGQQFEIAENAILELDDVIRRIDSDPAYYGTAQLKTLRNLQKRVEDGYEAVKRAPADQQPQKLYMLLDGNLKRSLGKVAKRTASSVSDEGRNTHKLLASLYDGGQLDDGARFFGLKPMLENVEAWGEQGMVQAGINRLLTETINLRRVFKKTLYGTDLVRRNPSDAWAEWLPVSDPDKIARLADDSVRPEGSPAFDALENYFGKKREFYARLKKDADLSSLPKFSKALDAQLTRIDAIEKQLAEQQALSRQIAFEKGGALGLAGDLSDAVPGVKQLRQLLGATVLNPKLITAGYRANAAAIDAATQRAIRAQAGALEAATGRMLQGQADIASAQTGAIVGRMESIAATQAEAAQQAATMQAQAIRQAGAMQAEATIGATGALGAAMEASGTPIVERVTDTLAKTQTRNTSRGITKVGRSLQDGAVAAARRLPVAGAMAARYEQDSKRVRELSGQSDAIRAQMEEATAWMAGRVPVARQAAIDTALRQLEYLAANLPKGLAPSTPFAPALPPSRSEVAQWMRRLRAVENPTSILDDLAAGKLTPESIDAVRTVYPETFADIQGQVLDKLTTMEQRGERPSYAKRVELGLLLGIPTDPTMTPESIAALQAQYQPTEAEAAGPQPAPPLGQAKGRKAPDFAAAYRSGSAETELTSEAT
jgi:hypothetical protein